MNADFAPEQKVRPAHYAGSRTDTLLTATVALLIAILHLLTNGRYGFHRDELQFLCDARHLDWGFISYPPFTPFVERIAMACFGLSLVGLRLFSVIAQSLAIFFTGRMARELGGGRLAQVATALAVALSPLPLFEGSEFQYTSFSYLWWVLVAYFAIRLLRSENPRWWLAIGAVIGLGLLTKYAIVFFLAGMFGGMLLTRQRRYFLSPWFWGGMAVALAIFLPNLVWQARHDFISLRFLHHIHVRDVGEGRAEGFVRDQFILFNLFAVPLWIAGLIAFLRDRRWRMLGWMYLIPLALLMAARGRGYYLAEAYPALIAMGAVSGERWLARLRRTPRWALATAFFAGLAVCGALASTFLLPISPDVSRQNFALAHNGDLREEIGWQDLVQTLAGIRDSLPPADRANVGIVVGNYGEQGAIEILGPAYHLPPPISGTNSAWYRGYPQPPPSVLIVVGLSHGYVERTFNGCRVAGHNGNPYGLDNEESRDHPDIFLCGSPRMPWPRFWEEFQNFG